MESGAARRADGIRARTFWPCPPARPLRRWFPSNKQDPPPRGPFEGNPMPIVKADRLTRIGAALLKAAGASDEEANAVASGCVNANLAGHDSHGVIAIPTYIDRVKAGHIVPGAKWTIVQESPTTTVIDGQWGFGFHVNAKAMELTINKAKIANVAACTVFRQSHVGRLAHYPMMAMREGMIAIATADSGDRKSTRLNSSHVRISYAVFCLKKK